MELALLQGFPALEYKGNLARGLVLSVLGPAAKACGFSLSDAWVGGLWPCLLREGTLLPWSVSLKDCVSVMSAAGSHVGSQGLPPRSVPQPRKSSSVALLSRGPCCLPVPFVAGCLPRGAAWWRGGGRWGFPVRGCPRGLCCLSGCRHLVAAGVRFAILGVLLHRYSLGFPNLSIVLAPAPTKSDLAVSHTVRAYIREVQPFLCCKHHVGVSLQERHTHLYPVPAPLPWPALEGTLLWAFLARPMGVSRALLAKPPKRVPGPRAGWPM